MKRVHVKAPPAPPGPITRIVRAFNNVETARKRWKRTPKPMRREIAGQAADLVLGKLVELQRRRHGH